MNGTRKQRLAYRLLRQLQAYGSAALNACLRRGRSNSRSPSSEGLDRHESVSLESEFFHCLRCSTWYRIKIDDSRLEHGFVETSTWNQVRAGCGNVACASDCVREQLRELPVWRRVGSNVTFDARCLGAWEPDQPPGQGHGQPLHQPMGRKETT